MDLWNLWHVLGPIKARAFIEVVDPTRHNIQYWARSFRLAFNYYI